MFESFIWSSEFRRLHRFNILVTLLPCRSVFRRVTALSPLLQPHTRPSIQRLSSSSHSGPPRALCTDTLPGIEVAAGLGEPVGASSSVMMRPRRASFDTRVLLCSVWWWYLVFQERRKKWWWKDFLSRCSIKCVEGSRLGRAGWKSIPNSEIGFLCS